MKTRLGDGFHFIATMPFNAERRKVGYADMNSAYNFVVRAYENAESRAYAYILALKSDVVIFGSAPYEYIRARIEENKLTFVYSERLYKYGYISYLNPGNMRTLWVKYGKHFRKNLYLLCAGRYVAADYAMNGCFWGKAYQWGYFPQSKQYANIRSIIENKRHNSILWVGRLIDWKQPLQTLEVAYILKNRGHKFTMTIVGDGKLKQKMEEKIHDWRLEDCVQMTGMMKPEAVRAEMEASEIFLFNSNRQEGWGAVLNEAMNSACAVVAYKKIGSVQYMINNKVNGFIYNSPYVNTIVDIISMLILQPEKRKALATNAYYTILNDWNEVIAADRLLALIDAIMSGEVARKCFANGICKRAGVICIKNSKRGKIFE